MPQIVTLRLDGRPIAFAYNLALEGTMHCYRLAFDPELYRFSPGLVNRFDALEYAFADGATRIEFLGGWSATRSSSPTARSRSTRDSGLRRASPARSSSPRG